MADEYSYIRGQNEHHVITGKPLELGGSKGRTLATSRGLCLSLKSLRKSWY